MAVENSRGITTKINILASAKKLFYNNGYEKTTFSEICKASEVNPGSVVYHFNNKITIADIIYKKFLDELNSSVEKIFPADEIIQQNMIALGLHIKLLFENPAYRRFSAEVCSNRAYREEIDNLINSVPKAYLVAKQHMAEKKARFFFLSLLGMDGLLETYIDKHIKELDFAEILEYTLELHYSFLEHEEFRKRLERTLHIIENLSIETDDSFEIIISIQLKSE